jgi:hypothetical protein
MNSRFLRSAGVVAALLIPVGGLTLVGTVAAGAVTHGSGSFSFSAPGPQTGSMTCTKITFTGSKFTSPTSGSTVCTESGSGGSLPNASGSSLKAVTGGFTRTAPKLVKTKVHATISFGTGQTCTVNLKTTLAVRKSGTTYSASSKSAPTYLKVTGSASDCGTLRTLLATASATFTLSLTT